MKRLENKTCLVTAAGNGIGKATAIAFAENGAKVIATDIDADALATIDHPSIETRILDVMSDEAIKAAASEIGTLDVLFNCAGFVHNGTILECSEKDWDFSFNLNVKSMYLMISAFLPGMIENGGGSVINMSSVASSIKGVPNRFVYTTTCNAICPATIETPSLHERLKATGDYEKALADFVSRQPIGRIGKADEVAALCVYLASDESGYTTGTTQLIDGGWAI